MVSGCITSSYKRMPITENSVKCIGGSCKEERTQTTVAFRGNIDNKSKIKIWDTELVVAYPVFPEPRVVD